MQYCRLYHSHIRDPRRAQEIPNRYRVIDTAHPISFRPSKSIGELTKGSDPRPSVSDANVSTEAPSQSILQEKGERHTRAAKSIVRINTAISDSSSPSYEYDPLLDIGGDGVSAFGGGVLGEP